MILVINAHIEIKKKNALQTNVQIYTQSDRQTDRKKNIQTGK